MKRIASLLAGISLLAFASLPLRAAPTVTVNDATLGYDYSLDLYGVTVPVADGNFDFSIDYLANSYFRFCDLYTIGEEFRFFSGTAGESISSESSIEGALFGNSIGPYTTRILPGQSVLFSFWDDRDNTTIPSPYDCYGWIRFRNVGGKLEIVDNATANGNGIIVGSVQAIPEPATILLFGTGIGLVWLRRRRDAA